MRDVELFVGVASVGNDPQWRDSGGPGNQYLCIVPDRSSKSLGTTDVFLPFEGDAVLSLSLRKAQLLLNDDQIIDKTMLRQ